MGVTGLLLDFMDDLNFKSLSQKTIASTKEVLIDTIAVALAGSSAKGVDSVYNLTKEWGGKPESSVLVFGSKLPAHQSAFVNSMMAHALDFDDIHASVAVHASCSVVPTALDMAEYLQGLSGKDLITSIVLGIEIASRLGLSILEQERGWHLSSVCGAMANAAVAAKLLGQNKDSMRHSLGIAYSQASGTLQSLIDGTLTKRMQPGFSAKSGILSAFLAEKGLSGPTNFLEGQYGFFKLFFSDNCDPKAITQNIGNTFEINNIGSKPYPCCRLAHTAIDAMLELISQDNFSIDEIKAIQVHGSSAMHTMCGKPYKITENSEIDAQFSLQYLLVSTILNRRIQIEDFSKEAVRNPVIAKQAKKVNVIISPEIKNRWGAIVDVEKKDGQILSKRVDIPRGQPENPMTWEEYKGKFRDCSRYAAQVLPLGNIEKFIQKVEDLEKISNVATLVRLLT